MSFFVLDGPKKTDNEDAIYGGSTDDESGEPNQNDKTRGAHDKTKKVSSPLTPKETSSSDRDTEDELERFVRAGSSTFLEFKDFPLTVRLSFFCWAIACARTFIESQHRKCLVEGTCLIFLPHGSPRMIFPPQFLSCTKFYFCKLPNTLISPFKNIMVRPFYENNSLLSVPLIQNLLILL